MRTNHDWIRVRASSRRRAVSARAWLRALGGVALLVSNTGCASLPWPGKQSTLEQDWRAAAARRASAEDAVSDEPQSFAQLMVQAERSRRSGNLPRAAWSYVQALELEPDNALPRERIASLQLEVEPQRALAIFEDLVVAHPQRASAHAGHGLALLQAGRPADAREALLRATQLSPETAAFRVVLAATWDRDGRHEEAQVELRQAHVLAPRDANVLHNLGVSELLAGDAVAAEESFRAARARGLDDVALKNNLGMALGRQGRYEEAFALFGEAGDRQAALNNLGYAYFLNDRYSEAAKQYERALLEGGPKQLQVLRNLNAALDQLDSLTNVSAPPPASP